MFKPLKAVWSHPQAQEAWAEFKRFTENIRSSFNNSLLEASPEFWSYHIGGIVLLLLFDITLNSVFTPAYVWKFYTLAAIVWGSGFFLSGLLLRSHYRSANWEAQPHVTVLFKAIASCVFFSFFIVIVMSAISMPLHFDDLYRYQSTKDGGISSLQVIAEFLFLNWFATTFYLLCWMMLYIGITSRRKTSQVEIDNLRLQNSLKEAELSSLSNQLNPHFLFNALNNIRFMIHEDADNAENMLMSLSSVLRYSLESSKKDKVALKDELEISQRYIDLIQIQFEERLRFVLNIPEALSTCQLPPMVLQMLLENAVKHGIDNIRKGGTIDVNAILDVDQQVLNIRVCNDLAKDYVKDRGEPGIGLFNIGQRLDLLYAGQGSINTKVADNRFCVDVKIPQGKIK